MKRFAAVLTAFMLAFALTARAQDVTPAPVQVNPSLLERFVGSSRETIVNRLPVGVFTVTITGERFPDRGYMLLDITAPPGVDASALEVNITFTPILNPHDADEGGAPRLADTPDGTFPAILREGVYVVDPIPTSGADTWLATVAITRGGETATGDFYTFIWPRSPELPTLFAVIALVLPMAIAAGTLLAFRATRVPLIQERAAS